VTVEAAAVTLERPAMSVVDDLSARVSALGEESG
jgi:hypothetical protein